MLKKLHLLSIFKIYIVASILFFGIEGKLYGQFPFRTVLKANSGQVIVTPKTDSLKKYRITVQGTYSQWTGFKDCHGVDAVWVYDVPQEEIDNFRFPPKTVLGQPFVEIPHWVGDQTSYEFPPKQLGLEPLLSLSFRKYLGFRVNDEPFPAFPLDMKTHRYQIERSGTGEGFRLKVLDSTYNLVLNRATPRYEDNCGELTVLIEEIIDDDINICSVSPIVKNGQVVGIKLDASILKQDTQYVNGYRNIFRDKEQLGIVINNKFICPDSIVCQSTIRSEPISVGLVVDQSGSMADTINGSSKMAVTKRSIQKFLSRLTPKDEAFLMSFGSAVKLKQDWTKDTNLLRQALDSIEPGGTTAFHQALIESVEKTKLNSNSQKAVIVLTDGVNNEQPYENKPVVEKIGNSDVRLYLLALNLGNDLEETIAKENMRTFARFASRGRMFDVNEAQQLDSIYDELGKEILAEECCTIYFSIPPCDPKKGEKQVVNIVYLSNDTVKTRKVEYNCATGTITSLPHSHTSIVNNNPFGVSIEPNPVREIAYVRYKLPISGQTNITLYDNTGKSSIPIYEGFNEIGEHSYNIDTKNITPGYYNVIIKVNGITSSQSFIFVK